ncbi:MAG: hypothetical protein EBZ74_07350 [Planctomycetia bacterium]|nr:hypothetical protein [Planctomycetia bacterium]
MCDRGSAVRPAGGRPRHPGGCHGALRGGRRALPPARQRLDARGARRQLRQRPAGDRCGRSEISGGRRRAGLRRPPRRWRTRLGAGLPTTQVSGPGNLDVAPVLSTLVPSLSGASLAQVSYSSAINGAEANLLATGERFHRPRATGYAADAVPYAATVDWLTGFRWAGLEEQAAITLATPGQAASRYGVRTSSNLFGGQLGVRGRIDWECWGLEGCGKAALAGVQLSQSQAPIVDAVTGQQYRPALGSRGSDVGSILEWNATIVRHLGDTWSIRAGYTMLWLTGVALAPDQFDFTTTTTAGTGLVGEKMVWLQGATLGLEGRW